MAPLSIQTYVVGPVQTNCYFAINDDTKEVLIIDPGASAKQLAEKVKEQGLKPVAILLTHGHFDHATGAGELAQLLHIKIYAQEKEKETLENPQLNLSGWQGSELVFYADEYLKDEQEIDLAGFHIRVFLTPGHTVGSQSVLIDTGTEEGTYAIIGDLSNLKKGYEEGYLPAYYYSLGDCYESRERVEKEHAKIICVHDPETYTHAFFGK